MSLWGDGLGNWDRLFYVLGLVLGYHGLGCVNILY